MWNQWHISSWHGMRPGSYGPRDSNPISARTRSCQIHNNTNNEVNNGLKSIEKRDDKFIIELVCLMG
jgi:hypothetical protein